MHNFTLSFFQVMFWFDNYTTTASGVNAIYDVTYQNGGDTRTHRALKQIFMRMIVPEVSGKIRRGTRIKQCVFENNITISMQPILVRLKSGRNVTYVTVQTTRLGRMDASI